MNDSALEQLSDEELAAACAQRPIDQDAFSELYRRYRPVVRKHILSKLRLLSFSQAEDLAQDTFLRLFGSLPRYDPKRLPLKSYVHMITDRVIVDFLRYGSLERAQTVAIEDHLRVLQVEAQEDPDVLLRVARRLASQIQDSSKVPLVLDLLQGIEPKEVVRRHGVKPNQVYAARVRLREILEDISSELPFPSQKIPALPKK
jgi:RNA polymerase sigma factor (sigma-70 family)